MSVFNPSNAPASPPERRAASDCGCDGSVGFPGSAAYILFDLDGTLTDPKEGITRCVQYALSKFGIQAECDALTNFIGPPLEESFGRFYGLSPADSKKAVDYYRERFTDVGIFENGVIDGIPELLLALSGADLSAEQQWMVPRPQIRSHSERLRVTSIIRYRRTSSSRLLSTPVSIYSFSSVSAYFVNVHGSPKKMRLRSFQTIVSSIIRTLPLFSNLTDSIPYFARVVYYIF